ncbi:MAG: pyridoxal-phosphate dependent enzyme [Candidatus Sumerlaeia bacterium]|nr:pyridoxal-phosphate dependent enzyme [Candidatus Sumerlaeia bacterium]
MKDPSKIPASIKERLSKVGLWDLDPANLYRITWKNEPVASGGGFNNGNWVEFPEALTGVPARIVGFVGKHFPTGAHKVGAAYGCLAPRLVTGQFDPDTQKAVWPSTGNYCRGGAFDCALLDCTPVAILPEGMSSERFDWLREIGAEVIATPGSESNVKEIYDKCWEIRRTRPDCVIFNQFEEFGNAIWHYEVTGSFIQDLHKRIAGPKGRMAGYVSATGSAGTIAAGDFLRTLHPALRVVAVEALQCPTLLHYGFGEHRIEGIGDKHLPWVHNIRNTDMICAVDDEATIQLMRLFNEQTGHEFLRGEGVPEETIAQLDLLGISCICNLVAAIKMAKYYELGPDDIVYFPQTDSMQLYQSRLAEQREANGEYSNIDAARHFSRYLEGLGLDYMRELNYYDRKSLHNFKYFTWVEQQGRTSEELRELWDPEFWEFTWAQAREWDQLIEDFNKRIEAGT